MRELEIAPCPKCKEEAVCMTVTHSLGDYTRSSLYRVECGKLRYAQSDCDYLGPIHTDADTAIRMYNALVAPETVFGKLRNELEAQPAPRTYEVARALTVLDMEAPLALSAPSPSLGEPERQAAVNMVCNRLNQHSRELGGAGMISEAQDYAQAAELVRRYFGDKK